MNSEKNYAGAGPSQIIREINNETILGTPAEKRNVYYNNRQPDNSIKPNEGMEEPGKKEAA